MPPIFVISLVRAEKRRAEIRERMRASGFRYEFIDAVDGAAEDLPALVGTRGGGGSLVDNRLYRLTRGRPLSNGEIGCYLSHYLAWEKVAALPAKCALIFEDDARWDDDLPQVIADIVSSGQQWGACLLTDDKGKCAFRKLHPVGENRFLGYPLKRTMALAGYLLTPRAAKNLCARLRFIYEPVDIAMCRHWEWNEMRLSVRPHVVRHDENETTINDRGSGGDERTVWNQILGGVVNIPEWCRRFLYYRASRPQK